MHPPWPGPGYGMRSQNRWPRKRGDKSARYPLYLCYTATLLKKNGYDVHYLDSVFQNLNYEQTFAKVKELSPDIIFIETATPTINYDKYFVDKIKDFLPNVKILFAGSHVTYFPEQTLKECKADIIIKGEQDYTTLNAINAIKNKTSLKKIKGIAYKEKNKIINNPAASLIQDLDKLPFPDRDLIPHSWYIEGHAIKLPFTFVVTARGCPNQCSFCLWPNIYHNHIVRYRSIKNVIDELKWLKEKYNMQEIFFDDGTLNVDKKRLIDLCKAMLKNKINLVWSCSCRVNNIDKEILYWMKKSGCKLICYGGESANPETLKKTNKGITVQQIKESFKLTKQAGIIVHANFMLGFPWESKEQMQKTIDFALSLEPDTVQFSLVFPHPGSRMYEEALKNNWFYEDALKDWSRFDMSTGPILKSKVSKKELENAISKSHAKFFLRPSYIIKNLVKVKNINDLKRMIKGAKSVIKGKILFKRKILEQE